MADLPEEFKNQMKSRLGSSYPAFLDSLQEPAPVSIRYNIRKLARPPGNEIPWCKTGRYLDERPSFTLDPLFHAGGYYVQEASSMLLEQAVRQTCDLTKPLIALDLCAAPGGKSTHLLSLLPQDSLLISNEVIRSRASVLTENIEKWGCDNVIVTNNDPSDFGRLPEFFDLILIDAPCSGEGLFRKEPESIEEWSPKNVEWCSLRQRRIVSDVWNSLKPGGIMIYSTCTYSEKENLENLDWFAGQQALKFENIALDPDWGVSALSTKSATAYQAFPHCLKGEGFFFSVARKSGNAVGKKIRTKDTLRYPAKAELSTVLNWVHEPESRLFFLYDQQIRMIHDTLQDFLRIALGKLHVVHAGIAVGEIMKNRIVPDHGLALSTALNKSNLSTISVDTAQALDYLRKNSLNLTSPQTGFHIVEFQGLGLGWVNMLAGRINNLYPSGRRILMK